MILLAGCQPPTEPPPALEESATPPDDVVEALPDVLGETEHETGDTDTAPPPPEDDTWWFGREAVHTIALTLDEDLVGTLIVDPFSYVPVAVVVDGVDVGMVGMHLTGSSSFEALSQKPNIKLKFDHMQEGLRVHGRERVALHNFHHDAARSAEFLASHFLRGESIPAPRIGYADLTLNGEAYGMYSVLETYDDAYLPRWLDDPTGDLWENPHDVKCDLDLEDCYERQVEGDGDDGSEIATLYATASLPAEEALPALRELFDWESVLTYLAAERVLGHWDSYSGNMNNYYLYHSPSTGKWQILLSSLDTAWGRIWGDEYADETRLFFGCGDFRSDPDDHYNRSLLSRLCAVDATCDDEVAARVAELADALEASDTVAEADALLDMVEPWVLADPRRNMSDEVHAAAVACFREWLPNRPGHLRTWLARREEGVLVATDAASYAPDTPITVSFDRLQADSDDTIALVNRTTLTVADWRYPDGTQVLTTRHIEAGSVTFAAGLPVGSYRAEVRFEDRPGSIASVEFAVH